MAFSIKSDEADRLARELAGLTGESLTATVTESLRERLERVRHQHDVEAQIGVERILAFGRRLRRHATGDERPADEIVGYDDHGLPT